MDLDESFFQKMKPGLSQFCQSEEEEKIISDSSATRYGEIEHIASGGMKEIFKVEDHKTGRLLAKAILSEDASKDTKKSFIREARLMAQLSHPNIIAVHDLSEDENDPWFTMDLLEGESLANVVRAKSLIERLGIFIKVCDAIEYAHSRKIIHLDIKPENVLIGDFGEVLLCDWGVAKKLGNPEQDLELDIINDHTLHGVIKGSPGYMAPEQISGGEKSYHTDIFTLGALLYYLTEDRKPFSGLTTEAILQKTLGGNFKFTKTSEALQAVIHKAMKVNANDRYSSVSAIRGEVENYLGGFATEAENADIFRQLLLLYKRNKAQSNILLASIIVISLLIIFFINQLQQREQIALTAKAAAEKAQLKAEENLDLYLREQSLLQVMKAGFIDDFKKYSNESKLKFNFNDAQKALDKALAYDDTNEQLWINKGHLHFIKLEFIESLGSYAKVNSEYANDNDLVQLATKYAGQNMTVEKISELIHLLRKRSKLIIFIIKHQKDSGKPPQMIASLVKTALCKFNGYQDINFKYKESDQSLDLSGNKKLINFKKRAAYGSYNFLEFLDLKSLNLSHTGIESLNIFSSSNGLEILNIQGTRPESLIPLLNLNKLKKLYIGKGQFAPEIISKLQSQDVEIIKE